MCSFSAFGLKSETNQSINHISQMRHARLPICAISPFISKTKAREFKIKAGSEIIKRCGREQQQIRAGKIKVKNVVGGQCRLVDIEEEKKFQIFIFSRISSFKKFRLLYTPIILCWMNIYSGDWFVARWPHKRYRKYYSSLVIKSRIALRNGWVFN